MKYYIISGEASGDMHGANLIAQLYAKDPQANIRCWGGDKMQAAGATLVKHYKSLAFMGFVEVVANLKTILSNISFCKKDIIAFGPDCIIYIDYPGFNLRIAKWAKEKNYTNIYYISPQVWAWKQSRVQLIKQVVDKMLVILPFEKEFYRKFNFEVEYVGHPLLDELNKYKQDFNLQQFLQHNNLNQTPIIALLSGSREQEVNNMLSQMLAAGKLVTTHQLVIAGAPALSIAFYETCLRSFGIATDDVKIIYNQTYELLQAADVAMVTSGTATLETALIGTPQVVCYKSNVVSYWIALQLIKVKYISLVNLIADKLIVKELIQHDMNAQNIYNEINLLLTNMKYRTTMTTNYMQLVKMLGNAGASSNAAQQIVDYLTTKK
ncbi:MAG: lipid-A-disaccharide synthase [Bacteroidia bacterium]|nr:lipid-A-disaccharide synthase [Bacteroidia bacterium]